MPDELVERVLSGEVGPSVSAIRAAKSNERAADRTDDEAYAVGGTFIDYLARFSGTSVDYAAGVAAHVLRRWKDAADREWLAGCLRLAVEMIDGNLQTKIPLLELQRTTVRRLKELG